ncbi:hypothetical protein D3C73_546490 [compost metagenome]
MGLDVLAENLLYGLLKGVQPECSRSYLHVETGAFPENALEIFGIARYDPESMKRPLDGLFLLL